MIRLLMAAVCALAIALAGATPLTAQTKAAPMAPGAEASAPLNLNAATQAQLEKLPGIGPSVAMRILEYRQKNGAFKKVEDLMNVRGVGEKSFLKLKSLVTVGPASQTR